MATVHALAPPGGSGTAGRHPQGYLQPLVGPLGEVAARVTINPSRAAEIGAGVLPECSARPEAVAVLLRRAGEPLTWGEPVAAASGVSERFVFDRGRSSVEISRAMPSLLSEMQIGAWFNAGWRGRIGRRLLVRVPRLATLLRILVRRPETTLLSLDVWFWAGVRARATAVEWRRLTKSSYVVLCYHQLSPGRAPTDWELDVPAKHFRRQLRLLRRLRYVPLTLEEVLTFHSDPTAVLGRRRFLITADDGYLDAIETLRQAHAAHPMVFVITTFPEDPASQHGDHAFANWDRVREAARAGVVIGAHTRRHRMLDECDESELEDELVGATADLQRAGLSSEPVLAYPRGRHDLKVRVAAASAGYLLAFTTEPGRNGAGTDHWCLRRINIKPDDGPVELMWKILTGEALPTFLQRRFDRRRKRYATDQRLPI